MTSPNQNNLEYTIELTPLALEMLTEVKDRREQQALSDRINKLKTDPEKQGKPLIDKLQSYFSVRAVGQRYRIIYGILQERVVVLVVGIGRRKEGDKKDIYTIMERLLEE